MQGAQALGIGLRDSGHGVELPQVAPLERFEAAGHGLQENTLERVGFAAGQHVPDGVLHVVGPQNQGWHPEIGAVLAAQPLGVPSHEGALHLHDVHLPSPQNFEQPLPYRRADEPLHVVGLAAEKQVFQGFSGRNIRIHVHQLQPQVGAQVGQGIGRLAVLGRVDGQQRHAVPGPNEASGHVVHGNGPAIMGRVRDARAELQNVHLLEF